MQLPDKFWHCHIRLIGGRRNAVINDMTLAELRKRIVEPWYADRVFPVAGLVVPAREKVETIRITQTDHPQQHYAAQHNMRQRMSNVLDMATDRSMLPIWEGKDYTHELR